MTIRFFPLINKVMAITRCPYCHAIIDENDKYCNNCGTQLLFPEDETLEEEIPGEKILDAETEEKDYDTGEFGKSRLDTLDEGGEERKTGSGFLTNDGEEGSEPKSIEDLLEAEDLGESLEEEEDLEEEGPEEVIVVDEIAAQEAAEAADTARVAQEPKEKTPPEIPPPVRPSEPTPVLRAVEPEIATEEAREPETVRQPEAAAEPEAAPAAPPLEEKIPDTTAVIPEPPVAMPPPPPEAKPLTFDTHELEGIGKTIDLGKEKLDKIIEDLSEKSPEPARAEPEPEPSPEPETQAIPVPEIVVPPVREPEPEIPAAPEPRPKTPLIIEPRTGTLPPWVDEMKGAPSLLDREDTKERDHVFDRIKKPAPTEETSPPEETSAPAADNTAVHDTAEEEIFPKRKPSDSGLGYPERLTQPILPFGPDALENEGEEQEEEIAAQEAEEVTPEETIEPPAEEVETSREAEPAAPPPVITPPARTQKEEVVPPSGLDLEADEEEPPPFSFSLFLKSKAFDGLFIGVFWLLALWLAAASLGTTLFGLFSVTAWPLLLLYVILIVLYIFLFKFFLGETLGDRLFKTRE